LRKSNEIAATFAIPAAIVVGLSMAPRLVSYQYAVPLFDFSVVLWEFGVLDFVRIVLGIGFLRFGLTSWLIVLAVVEIFILWTARYSATGAFFPQNIINGLLLLSLLSLNRDQVRSYAAKAFSLIFILAALQKINASYLAGSEFVSPKGFLSMANYFLGHLPSAIAVKIMPWLSIAIELAVGVGLLWRPSLFTHVATLFILILSIVHPSVLYVYFTAFFFLALIDTRFFAVAVTDRLKSHMASPFFWAIATSLVVLVRIAPGQVEIAAFLRMWPILIILMLIHGAQILGTFKLKEDFSAWWRLTDFDLRTQTFPKLVVLGFVGLFFAFKAGVVPTPLGFSMFSGFDPARSPYKIEIDDRAFCEKVSRRILIFDFSDASMRPTEQGCRLLAPTSSGRRAALRQFCRDYPDLQFRLNDEAKKSCSDLGSPVF
jgi:hypothetical protein